MATRAAYADGWRAMDRLIASGSSWSGHERKCCFLNVRGGQFANVSSASGLDLPDDGRAVATTDWDLDGDLDLWVSNRTAPAVRFLRNDLPPDKHYLAFKLVGKQCNRDAIGARVEVQLKGSEEPHRLLMSLRAGEGFLGQSSKWVHFGLGKHEAVRNVIVHWPQGGAEELGPLAVDRRYEMTQGDQRAVVWQAPRKTEDVVLSDAQPKLPESTQTARVVAFRPRRPELPVAHYETFDGRDELLKPRDKRPLLLTLWAGWCAPCITELDAFSGREKELRAAGVEILALNVEALEGTTRKKAVSPEEFLKKRAFAFSSGIATTEIVQALEDIQYALIHQIEPLPIPTSFLIDSSDDITRVAVIYKGPVTVDRILADAELLNADPAVVRAAAVPFPGRWSQEMGRLYEDRLTVSGLLTVMQEVPVLAISIGATCCLLLLVSIRILRQRKT